MIHKNKKTARFLAAFLVGIITFTSGGFEVLAAEPADQTKLEASLEEESDKVPETSANTKEDLENTPETDETTNETPDETTDTDEPADPEEKPDNPEEEPGNSEEKPSNPEEEPNNPEEEPSNPEEEPDNPEEEPIDSEEEPDSSLTETVNSEGGSYKNITWNIDTEGKLTVTGSGEFSEEQYFITRAPWYDYRNSIKSAVINVTGMTNALGMFYDCRNLESIDLSGLDTSNITNMSYMFNVCRSLKNLDVSKFNTSKVTNMSFMFSDCRSLTELDLTNFDTEKVTNMESMFSGCFKLTSLDLSGLDAGRVSNMEDMFLLCNILSTIHTPYNVTQSVSLPVSYGDVWYNPNGAEITELPKNLDHSITVARNRIPAPLESEQKIQLYAPYDQSQAGQTFNIIERFSNYGGISGCEIISYTEDAKISGNVLSASPTLNNGILNYSTNAGTIGDFATITIELTCITQEKVTLIITICLRDTKSVIAEGSYKSVTWTIDGNGKLTIEGRGNFKPHVGDPDWNQEWTFEWDSIPWLEYCTSVKSAEVNVTGITDSSYMFYGCGNMSKVDLSNLDTTNVTNMCRMFGGCGSLSSLDLSGFDTSKVKNMNEMFVSCSGLSELDVSNFNTSNVEDMSYMFCNCSGLSELDISNFDTSNTTNISGLFSWCSGLRSIDVSHLDTSNVTNMSRIFEKCTGLTSLDLSNFDTSHATDLSYMFADLALSSLDVSNIDISNATDISGMFSGCTELTSLDIRHFDTSKVTKMAELFAGLTLTSLDVSNIDTSNATDISYMFSGCTELTSLDISHFNTSKVTNMSGLFAGLTLSSLDISNIDISNATNISGMFSGCTELTSLDISHFDTSKVTNMSGLFQGLTLSSLDISNIDTSNVTDMSGMFAYCTELSSLDLSNFDISKVTNMGFYLTPGMFEGCVSLTSLDLSNFDTSNVIYMDRLFYRCTGLSSLDVSGFDTSNVTSMYRTFSECTGLSSLDLSHWDTSNVTNMEAMFESCTGLTSLDLSHFDTSSVTNMSGMFMECTGLISLDVSSFDTSKVTNMRCMFYECPELVSLDVSHFDTSKVTDMCGMFSYCNSLSSLDVSHFTTSNVIEMGGMFAFCTELTSLDVSNFNTSKVTDMGRKLVPGMFEGCALLTSLDLSNFDTSNVRNMWSMFSGCSGLTNLDLSGFDTSKVKDMSVMFEGCAKLTSLDVSSFDTSNVTEMGRMFGGCSGLKSLDLRNFNTSNVTTMGMMFHGCTGLTSLDVSSFDTSNVTNMNTMFTSCFELTNLDVSSFNTSKVTRMSMMFDGCFALRSLDLSNFDLTNVTFASSMLGDCENLLEIHTPLNLSTEVDLPDEYYGTWYKTDGSKITKLPKNLSYSILIKRDKAPTSPSKTSLTATKTKKVYVCGESLNIDDITVIYTDSTGNTTTVTDFTTNADEIDMSVPGKKILKVTYKGMTAEIELKVTCSLTDSQVTVTVTLPEQTFVYSRLPITPEPTVTVRVNGTDILLYEGRDYKLSYQNNVNAGIGAQIIITGHDIYSGTITRTFSIEKAPLTITASDITLIVGDELPDASAYEYQVQGICRGDKLIKKPSFTCDVTDMSKTGTYTITPHNADAGSNYEITYDSGTLTVVENGVYHTVVFDLSGHGSNMTRRAIKTGSLLKEPAQPHGPESTGYLFSGWYKDKSFAAKQKWNFALDTVQDDITLYACWLSMAAENENGADLCIQDILPQTYTGSPIKPTVLVYDGDGTTLLKSGKDYSISYYNNKEADALKFADLQIPTGGTGTLLSDGGVDTSAGFNETLAYVVIKGKGNYKGTIYRNFHIDKALISANGDTASGSAASDITASGITLKYTESLVCNDKKEQKPFTSIKYKKAMTAGKDYTITLSANAGEAYTAKAADGTGIPLNENWQQSNNGKTLPTIPKGYFGKFKMTIEGIGNYGGTVEKTIYVSADKSHLMKNVSVTLGKNQKKKANATKEELEQGITLTPAYYDASNKKYYLFDENGEPTGTPMDKADDVFAVKAGKTSLKYGKDYVISSYVNNHAIGTATMIIQGIGEYTGTKNISFTITGTPFKNITVEGLTDMSFTGKAVTQSDITLTNGRVKTDSGYKKFEYGTDYSIAYKNNIKKGKATITFTAKPESGYKGSFKKTFKITAADLNQAATAAAINSGDKLNYEQNAYTFSGTVYYTKSGATLSDRIRLISSEYADITLKEGVDYTVNYTNNKAVTTGSDAIMRLKGKGNYQGTLTIKFPITSAPISAENKNLTITAGAVYYDGKKSQYIPKIKVSDGKKALSIGENKDYVVKEYINNDKAAIEEYLQLQRSGAAIPRSKKPQAVLSGKGNYNGDTTLYFDVYGAKINNNNLYIVISNDSDRLTYSGRQLKPEIAVYYGKDVKKVKAAKLAGEQDENILTSSVNGGYGLTKLTNRIDYTLTWGSNLSAGKNKGSVTITGIGLYGGKVTGKFTILSKDIYALR